MTSPCISTVSFEFENMLLAVDGCYSPASPGASDEPPQPAEFEILAARVIEDYDGYLVPGDDVWPLYRHSWAVPELTRLCLDAARRQHADEALRAAEAAYYDSQDDAAADDA